MADYAHCANVKSSAQKMEICKRTAMPTAQSHTAATLMAAGVRSGNVTLTFNNQLGGRVGAAAQVVNGRAVLERTAAYDAHFQVEKSNLIIKPPYLGPPYILPSFNYSMYSAIESNFIMKCRKSRKKGSIHNTNYSVPSQQRNAKNCKYIFCVNLV